MTWFDDKISNFEHRKAFYRNIISTLITFMVGTFLLVFGVLLRLLAPDPLALDLILLHIGMILGAIILSGFIGGFIIGNWREGFKPTFEGGLFATFVFFHVILFLLPVSYSGSLLTALFNFELVVFTISTFSGLLFGLFGMLGGFLAQILK